MKKLGCAKCGGTKKMAKGGSTLSGSAIKKAPVQLYGIPQENMGTSGQYGKMKKGGTKKSFPDLNKDGKVTKADILKGRGIIKKKGGVVKKRK
jgi:hypothetical protein